MNLLPKDSLDKYYTRSTAVKKCLSNLPNLNRYDYVVEPSAGSGAFYYAIKHKNKIGMDIEPEAKDIITQDWFSYKIPQKYKNVLVIGNPPFGRNNSISTAFIKQAFSFCNVKTIAFILPNVFNKHTRQKLIPKDWRIASITDLGENMFEYEGKVCHVPCSFFVFDSAPGLDLRVNPSEYKDKVDFYFGDKDSYDFFMFGAAPKKIITNPKPNNRGHFIKSKIDVNTLIRRMTNINWRGNSCANGGVY